MFNKTASGSVPKAPPPRGANLIANKLAEAITSGVYDRGAQLPTERQLAEEFVASRTTVRKALAVLEVQKLVQRRPGSGTYVSYHGKTDESGIVERTSPLQLIEVRAVIEPQMARLAVLHASQVDLDKLQLLVKDLKAAEKAGDSERYAVADEKFHLAIASTTSNPLMVWLYEQINVIRTHALWAEMRQKIITRENMRLYNEQHAAVVKAIQARDGAAAAEMMVRHMDKARDDLVGAHSR
ncbi:FadR/GntR family transcriptional regulator [Hyphomicrobium sp. 2TAF46]|uniref:FadR/GntR family transcriptional regulator n=1 Tax=Hyphomicrobium sp. 2TAF46 TaxID=3233019 RepID=UPI003F925A05